MSWSGVERPRVYIADTSGPQIPIREGRLERTKRGHAARPDGVRGMIQAEGRCYTTRARLVRGIQPEAPCSESVNRGRMTRPPAVRGERRDNGRGRTLRVDGGRGFESETACSERTDRGHATRTEAIRGRYRSCLIHLFFGSNPGLSG